VVHSQVMQGWEGGREVNFVFLCDQGLWLLASSQGGCGGPIGRGDARLALAGVLAAVA